MSLLTIDNLTHGFGEKTIYQSTSLTLNKGERMGILGHNGSGKSTLIKICTGELIPDHGLIQWHPKIRIGYLDQYAMVDRNLTIEAFLQSAFQDLFAVEKKMLQLYESFTDNPAHLKRAAEYQEQLETGNFYHIQTEIEKTAQNLGLTAIGLDRKIAQLSGGQRAKVILAKLLLEKPDVLLLDEPTNFLDTNHVDWLATYLSTIEQSFMIVSHDHGFLRGISNCICDVENGQLKKYNGTYSDFIRQRHHNRDIYIRHYEAQQKHIKKTEAFIRKNIAGIKSKNAKGRRKQLARLDRLAPPSATQKAPVFKFHSSGSHNHKLQVQNLTIGYTEPLVSNLNFKLSNGQKAVITGFNGIGKTTLIKTLTGELKPIRGKHEFSDNCSINYYAQDLKWNDPELTPVEIVSNAHTNLTEKEIRKQLSRCSISREHARQHIKTLSGGEQTKVKLCLLTLSPSNFLIMDEPTNHLDKKAKDSLKEALKRFPGSLILVSHEKDFFQG
ncbi:MAG: ABC-F family ATP-binding cassette domain-containing protein, partial [Thermotogota bacterium]|nr:ABC-F family ATP-binding cassette domain-containing protein [Thermotogota bacterium]